MTTAITPTTSSMKDYMKTASSATSQVLKKVSIIAVKVFADLVKLSCNPVVLAVFVVTAVFAPKFFAFGLLVTLLILTVKNLPNS